jgi:hypothetical protein
MSRKPPFGKLFVFPAWSAPSACRCGQEIPDPYEFHAKMFPDVEGSWCSVDVILRLGEDSPRAKSYDLYRSLRRYVGLSAARSAGFTVTYENRESYSLGCETALCSAVENPCIAPDGKAAA